MKLYVRTIADYADADTEVLEDARQRRLARITNPKVRAECIAAGSVLREALSDYGYSVGDRPLTLSYDADGKPGIADGPFFSISHSGDIVTVAVDDAPIGVDVQIVKKMSERLAKRILTEEERTEFESFGGEREKERDRYMTVRWTEKESIAKLLGGGIGINFRTIRARDYRLHTVFRTIEDEEYVITVAQNR